MRIKSAAAACTAVVGASLAAAHPVQAQFPGGTGRFSVSGGGAASEARVPVVSASVGLYPVASFQESGFFPRTGRSGTRSRTGSLVSLDVSYRPASVERNYIFELGGWYWTEGAGVPTGDDYVYQFHGRMFFSKRRDYGIQGAIIQTSDRPLPNRTSYTIFAIGELNSVNVNPRGTGTPWAIQAGVGVFLDPTYDRQREQYGGTDSEGFTVFIAPSLQLNTNLSLGASVWYLRSRQQDLNRVALGINYGF